MTREYADPTTLVKTEAETVPPPGPTVPEPPANAQRQKNGKSRPDAVSVVHRLKQLADEVGGFNRLRELIDELEAK